MHDADAVIPEQSLGCNSEPIGQLKVEYLRGDEWVEVNLLAITKRQANAYLEFVGALGRLPDWTRE